MNILTIDLEEWYIYDQFPKGGREYYLPIINNYLENILNLLEINDIKSTFFCLGIIARNDPGIIKMIADRGHEIGCHSDQHRLITAMNPESFREDTKTAIDSLEQLVGKKVNMYRAPAFSITENNKWAIEVLIESGIEYDSSVFPANHRFGGFASIGISNPAIIKTKVGSLKEFPISFASIASKKIMFAGGGYFRLFPYLLIKYLTKKADYNMSYFHIRDMDRYQKIVKSASYFYSYYGIKGAFKKFEKYVSEFPFLSIGEADKQINWNESRIISL